MKTTATNQKENKWQQLSDLMYAIETDSTLSNTPIKCLSHASFIGERMWIAKYKDVYVALYDLGNCHWEYFSRVSLAAVIYSVVYEKVDFLIFKLMNERKRREGAR